MGNAVLDFPHSKREVLMTTDSEQSPAVLSALLRIETAAELTAILAETDAGKAASAIAALQLDLEERMQAEGDGDATKHAELMSHRIQDAWVTLRKRVGEA